MGIKIGYCAMEEKLLFLLVCILRKNLFRMKVLQEHVFFLSYIFLKYFLEFYVTAHRLRVARLLIIVKKLVRNSENSWNINCAWHSLDRGKRRGVKCEDSLHAGCSRRSTIVSGKSTLFYY